LQQLATQPNGRRPPPDVLPLWDELDVDAQNGHVQRVMALARGEQDPDRVFAGTAAAILGYNGGQGLLALEELSNIGGAVLALGLAEEADVADKNMRAVVVQMLEELAEWREGGSSDGMVWDNPRFLALRYATQLDGSIESAKVFEAFIHDGEGEETESLLDLAIDTAKRQGAMGSAWSVTAADVVAIAQEYSRYLHEAAPPLPDAPSFDNSSDEPPAIKSGETVN
jgi:hypothetical protein